jgi:hypothetical protein
MLLVVEEALQEIETGWVSGMAAGTPLGGAEISGRPKPYTIC